MSIDKIEQRSAMDKAFKKAGHNAYFANGFNAGVDFALSQQRKYIIPNCMCECHQDGSCGFYHCFGECCTNIDHKFINQDGTVDGARYEKYIENIK